MGVKLRVAVESAFPRRIDAFPDKDPTNKIVTIVVRAIASRHMAFSWVSPPEPNARKFSILRHRAQSAA
jgi:hypothetical protein